MYCGTRGIVGHLKSTMAAPERPARGACCAAAQCLIFSILHIPTMVYPRTPITPGGTYRKRTPDGRRFVLQPHVARTYDVWCTNWARAPRLYVRTGKHHSFLASRDTRKCVRTAKEHSGRRPKRFRVRKQNSGWRLNCSRTAKECSGRGLKRSRVRKQIPDGV